MQLPQEPTSQSPINARWGIQVVKFLRDLDRRLRAVRTVQTGKKGSPAASRPFQLLDASVTEGGTTTYKVRIVTSLFGIDTPDFAASTGFSPGDDPPCVFTVTEDGELYGHATLDHSAATSEAALTDRVLGFSASMPTNTETEKYIKIGSWHIDTTAKTLTPANDCYGPIGIDVCRDWFSNPKKYGLTFMPS